MYYTHRSRAFHAQLIAHIYNNDSQRKVFEGDPSLVINHIVPVYQSSSRGSGMASMKFLSHELSSMVGRGAESAGEAWWDGPPKRQFNQTWLRPRVSQLVEGYRDEKFSNDVRVAEGIFQSGHMRCFAYLTVKLCRSTSGKYEAVYCVSRYSDKA